MAISAYWKSRIYRTALRLHIPIATVLWAIRTSEFILRLGDCLSRRREASKLMKNSRWQGFVPKETGARLLAPGELPGSEEVLTLCRSLLEERRDKAREIKRSEGNPFDMLINEEVFQKHPSLISFATSPALIEIATDYFGTVPRLEYIDLWVSSPEKNQDRLYNSQLYHTDKIDQSILTLFLAIEDIDNESGPFTLLPADVSKKVISATGYVRNYLFGTGRLTDESVYAEAASSDALVITGRAGAGGFCDTGCCLHFGSRCQTKERAVLVLRYYSNHQSATSIYRTFTGSYEAQSVAGQMLLAD